MAGKRHGDGRLCQCDQADRTCVALAVQRLSQERVQELAEEIWTAASGDLLAAGPRSDPQSSRAGASAQAAYRRRRTQEREAWRLGWLKWTAAVIGAAAVGALVVGLSVGAWLGWPMGLLLAVWAGWRLRFRPSAEAAGWRRQAAMQRRTAGMLAPLAKEGWLVLHDLTLPGWPGSLEHLVVGPTGVWVIQSWQRRGWLPGGAVPAGILRELRSHTQAIAELLDGWAQVPVQSLLSVHRAWLGTRPTLGDIPVTASRRLAQVVRSGSPLSPGGVEQAAGRLLDVLRPAA